MAKLASGMAAGGADAGESSPAAVQPPPHGCECFCGRLRRSELLHMPVADGSVTGGSSAEGCNRMWCSDARPDHDYHNLAASYPVTPDKGLSIQMHYSISRSLRLAAADVAPALPTCASATQVKVHRSGLSTSMPNTEGNASDPVSIREGESIVQFCQPADN